VKIVKLQAKDILRLSAVEITPEGNTVVISGKNAAGKSSVLNAIWLALGGGDATRALPEPVRKGAGTGDVSVDLGDIMVTKKFKKGKTPRLEVTSADGASFPSPQAMLDELVGRLSFDPLAFAQAPAKEQLTTLMDILGIDADALEKKRKGIYDERTTANREVRRLESLMQGFSGDYKDAPDEEVSGGEIIDQMQTASIAYRKRDEAERRRREIAAELVHKNTLIDEMKAKLAALEEEEQALRTKVATATQEFDQAIESATNVTAPAELEVKLTTIEDTNRLVREKKQHAQVKGELHDAQMVVFALNDQIAKLDEEKKSAVEEANLPVEGLGLDEDGVTLNDLPFRQASSAEQLRTSLALAMALNPKLRVVRITDGSLLDEANMRMIEEMADEQDFQVWVEVVDSSGQLGIYIEDGHVAAEAEPSNGE